MKPTLLFDEMYDGKEEEMQKLDYEAYSVKKLRRDNQKLQSDYSIIKLVENEGMVLATRDGENNDACIENKIPFILLGENPSPEIIIEKLNALNLAKPTTRRKKLVLGGITIALGTIFAILAYQHGSAFANLTYGFREFVVSGGEAGAGITIMFLKKKARVSPDKKFMESMELLMFFITPTAFVFPLLPNGEYKLVWIMILYFSVSVGWLVASLLLVTRGGPIPGLMTNRAKYVLFSIFYLWSYLLAIGFLIVYLFLVIKPIQSW